MFVDCYKKRRLNPHFRELIKSRTILKKKKKKYFGFFFVPELSQWPNGSNKPRENFNKRKKRNGRKKERSLSSAGWSTRKVLREEKPCIPVCWAWILWSHHSDLQQYVNRKRLQDSRKTVNQKVQCLIGRVTRIRTKRRWLWLWNSWWVLWIYTEILGLGLGFWNLIQIVGWTSLSPRSWALTGVDLVGRVWLRNLDGYGPEPAKPKVGAQLVRVGLI